MKIIRATSFCVAVSAWLFSGVAVSGQNGGPFDLRWSTIDGGGGACAGGKLSLSGSVGQPDAATGASGGYVLQGGFWPAEQKTVGPPLRLERSGGDFILSWPLACLGFRLEAALDVTARTWTDLGPGFPFGPDRFVPVPGNQRYRFFRLRKDCPH